jgi:hypothetical protein
MIRADFMFPDCGKKLGDRLKIVSLIIHIIRVARRENPFPDRRQRKKGVENNDSAPALGSVLV